MSIFDTNRVVTSMTYLECRARGMTPLSEFSKDDLEELNNASPECLRIVLQSAQDVGNVAMIGTVEALAISGRDAALACKPPNVLAAKMFEEVISAASAL